jgi:hypothetical protein
MTDISGNNLAPSPALVRAVRSVMRPLVRLMVSKGLTYPLVAELLKGVFVDVAQQHFQLDARALTDSRISLLTGVHRKDVRRLREMIQEGPPEVPESVSFGTQLVAKWLGNAQYLDESGEPLPLPRLGTDPNAISFEQLVASQSKDIRARVVLDEWLRLGIVSLNEQDQVVLNTQAFVPKEGSEEQLYFFAHNLHDHATAATDNLLGRPEPWLERGVQYDALSTASVTELNLQSKQWASRMLKALNRSAMEMEGRDASTTEARQRFTCGVYFYSAPTELEVKP